MYSMHRLLLALVLLADPGFSFAAHGGENTPPPAPLLAKAREQADAAVARADLAAYRGWIKFLRFEAETAVTKRGATSEDAQAKTKRLAEWVERITANPNLLATLSGVQEWAYESPADGSGQPFKMAIPTDYDPAHPAPLSVYMHGYSGNHLEHATGMASHPGSLDLSVLGRSRGGGYAKLSEADVLDVIDYVSAHWAIDPDRIHLNGGSMGGGGTYRLGARYPHRWASGRPTCGYASFLPIGNLLTFPIYATHSADDYVVSVLHDRGPLARLRELGGQVVYDETNGYGHAVWEYKEGNERGAAWEKNQVRPGSRTVRHVDFTATDGDAVRGWWGEIAEWGGAPKPARFVLTAGISNQLFAELTNVTRLRLRLAESPFDRALPLQVAVNGAVPVTLPAPLPESVVLAQGGKGWAFEPAVEPPPYRLHTPGSAALLYNGEPLLIVYGTSGKAAAVMRAAAEAASKSPNAAWLDDTGDAAKDGVPHSQNLYGHLNIKADTAVTDGDIARCHLVLIGTAAQNTLVARLADRLPVRFADGSIICSDGVKFPGKHNALGLVHYNPLAPDRLIFWVASDERAVYAAKSWIPLLMGGNPVYFGADLLVMNANAPTLVAARSFDSRWRWTPGREASPLVPASIKTQRDFTVRYGAAIRRAAGADFALVGSFFPAAGPLVTTGVTRVSDLLPLFYDLHLGVCEMTGAALMDLVHVAGSGNGQQLSVYPAEEIAAGRLNSARSYRVVLSVDVLWTFSGVAQLAPRNYQHTDLLVTDALERFFVSE
jgi:hypothetical protein